jgi:hypothetical protein
LGAIGAMSVGQAIQLHRKLPQITEIDMIGFTTKKEKSLGLK